MTQECCTLLNAVGITRSKRVMAQLKRHSTASPRNPEQRAVVSPTRVGVWGQTRQSTVLGVIENARAAASARGRRTGRRLSPAAAGRRGCPAPRRRDAGSNWATRGRSSPGAPRRPSQRRPTPCLCASCSPPPAGARGSLTAAAQHLALTVVAERPRSRRRLRLGSRASCFTA